MKPLRRGLLCVILAIVPRYVKAQREPVRLDPIVVREAAPPKTLRATEQLIQGKLLDEDTGLPIARGNIELWSDADKPLATATTDTSGIFQIITPSPGLYALRGRRLGYQPARQSGLSLRLGDTLIVEFRLSHLAQVLDPVQVTASAKPWPPAAGERQVFRELYDRMKRFSGLRHAQFILRDTIDAYANRFYSIGQMVSRVVVPPMPKPRETRCKGTTQYVDGLPLEADSVIPATAFYDLNQIDLVEVYTHPSIPSEFAAPMIFPGSRSPAVPPCRVISLWTRYKNSPLAAAARDTTTHRR